MDGHSYPVNDVSVSTSPEYISPCLSLLPARLSPSLIPHVCFPSLSLSPSVCLTWSRAAHPLGRVVSGGGGSGDLWSCAFPPCVFCTERVISVIRTEMLFKKWLPWKPIPLHFPGCCFSYSGMMQVRGLVERPLRFYRPLLSSLAVQWKLWAGPDDQARVL